MSDLYALAVRFFGEAELERGVPVALLLALRLGPLTVLTPWIALRGSPPLLRAALLFVLTAALLPHALASAPPLPTDLVSLVAIGLREVALGTMLAIACALPLHALHESGRLVDVLRGAQGESSGPSGLVLAAMAEGVHTLPPGAGSVEASAFLEVGRALTHTLTLAVSFAAPALLSLVVSDVALGLVARSAPQIPVHFAGMPLRSAVGIAALLLSLALLVPHLGELFAWTATLVGSLLASG
jgi:type III secretory pathway component EscT